MRPPTLVAASVALLPALAWAYAAGAHALSWRGLALLTGFAAVGLLAVSMLLMLRAVWLDRAFGGLARLYRAHHELGLAGFVLLLVHPLALAVTALGARPSEALRLLWPNPSSSVVFSGWLALLLFTLFFVATVSSRLRFELWRRAHRAAGLAYGAMAWHLVATWSGSTAAGIGLGLVVAGALGYAARLLAQDPLRYGLRYRVMSIHRRGPSVVDLVLEAHGERLQFAAGQFVYLALRDSASYRACGEVHPYTLTGRPDDPRLHLSIKALGDCTSHIQEVTVGTEAIIQGPYGGLFPDRLQSRPQLWIAGGMGVTPFLGRATTGGADGPPIDLIYAAANERAALYLDDLRSLARSRPNLRVHTMFDSDGLPTLERIEARAGALEGKEIMLAGPPAMVRALVRQLRARGVPASRIHSEEGLSR